MSNENFKNTPLLYTGQNPQSKLNPTTSQSNKLYCTKLKDSYIIASLYNSDYFIGIQKYRNGAYYAGFFNNKFIKTGFGLFYKDSEKKNYCYGLFLKGKPNGIGIEQFEDGSFYEGQFLDGKKNGVGQYFMKNGKIYQGNWVNNYFQGYGKFIYSNEKYYIGNFVRGVIEGYGFYCHSTKIVFAHFINGIKHGPGVCYDKDNQIISVSMFEKGKKNGPSKELYKDEKIKYYFYIDGIEQKVNTPISSQLINDFFTEDYQYEHYFSLSYNKLKTIFSYIDI